MIGAGEFSVSAPESQVMAAPMCYTEAPILLLVLFHKAMRAELAEIRRLVSAAVESEAYGRDLVVGVLKRFEFVKIAYKYHCAAEDEVIFFALEAHVNNVAHTYSLEHRSIDGLFKSVFHSLDILMENDEYLYKPLQELVSYIGTLQTAVCKHMMKEERQVFPLLIQQFSSIEQASLVWRFMCNVPITLLMDVLPWMTSFLAKDEQIDVLRCMKEVIPKENLLQEVVLSWLAKNSCSSVGISTKNTEGTQCFDVLATSKTLSEEHPIKIFPGIWKKEGFLQTNTMLSPVDSVSIWHGAIQKDLKEILEDLYQIRSSNNHTDLASVLVQLNFFVDVLMFYRKALDKILYPVLKEVTNNLLSLSSGHLFSESQIEGLQKSLYYNSENGMPLCKFVERLYCEVQSFLMEITKQFAFHEKEVFPLIIKNCNDSMQHRLLYMSLQTMPLGLLKCVITWFAAHLSEDQSIFILSSIKDGLPLKDKSFTSLLLEWIRTGYSGKTSVENFRKDLHIMFGTKCLFLSDQINKDTGSSSVHVNAQPCNRYSPGLKESIPDKKAKDIESNSSSYSQTSEMHTTLYSSRINMHIFFPGTLEILCPSPKILIVENNGDFGEARPVDYILFFHRALKKDLEYLVFGSTQLAEDLVALKMFCHRFDLVQLLYRIHSDAEDEIAFPALKAKGNKCENISNSYTIDHKIEADHFADVSLILDEISEVHASISSDNVDKLDQKMVKYRQLCVKLHDMCKTMYKLLCDHMNHEEIELWPLFGQCFSDQEQEKIIGYMLGRTRAEVLEEMIPWLMAYLTQAEQQALMSLWRKATKNTMFDEWLQEWWVGMKRCTISSTTEELNTPPLSTIDPLELISTYLSKEGLSDHAGTTLFDKDAKYPQKNFFGVDIEQSGIHNEQDKGKIPEGDEHNHQCSQCTEQFCKSEMKSSKYVKGQLDKPGQELQLLSMSQEDLEAIIRRIYRDSSLDSQQKSSMIQSLLTRQWMVKQQKSSEARIANADEILGRSPSYRDHVKLSFGCKHYKRNCKLLAACCNQLYACRNCHDEVADHSMDRKATTKMMCMKCLIIQPIGPTCSTASCDDLSMAKYYCRICKLFDDVRDIYHCPYCNLCRVGKGLGIDYFHCMNCNACMSPSLSVHICREKSFEDKCPICHEDIFTSSTPVKALPCGHMMHSACFQDYTCTHYTCPMCSKSLGDMQVYFGMLDALLAEEKIPDEYSGRTQIVLCNDCEKRGSTPYHWLHHKCPFCGSYNTRVL